jgi:hypothetical protein
LLGKLHCNLCQLSFVFSAPAANETDQHHGHGSFTPCLLHTHTAFPIPLLGSQSRRYPCRVGFCHSCSHETWVSKRAVKK